MNRMLSELDNLFAICIMLVNYNASFKRKHAFRIDFEHKCLFLICHNSKHKML